MRYLHISYKCTKCQCCRWDPQKCRKCVICKYKTLFCFYVVVKNLFKLLFVANKSHRGILTPCHTAYCPKNHLHHRLKDIKMPKREPQQGAQPKLLKMLSLMRDCTLIISDRQRQQKKEKKENVLENVHRFGKKRAMRIYNVLWLDLKREVKYKLTNMNCKR